MIFAQATFFFDNKKLKDMSFTDVFKKIFGTKADRDMKAIRPMLDKVLVAYSSIDKLTDDELREKCQSLKDRYCMVPLM